MDSLYKQTLQDFEILIFEDTAAKGAPWARNMGARSASGEYILFSDADVVWAPDALEAMLGALSARIAIEAAMSRAGLPLDGWRTAYSFGGYTITGAPGGSFDGIGRAIGPLSNAPWNFIELQHHNMVSTMSLMLRSAFTGWDESLRRLQDWDLWLSLALYNRFRGEWVGRVLYTTPYRETGISFGGSGISYEEAALIVLRKHGLAG